VNWVDTETVTYKFYRPVPLKSLEFVDILPEKRRDPARITEESAMNWGRETWDKVAGGEDIFFIIIIMIMDDSEKLISAICG
jgi:hypothetical protein